MLVIRRGRGDSLLIGDNVEIEILDIGSSYVKVGIRAPRELTVLRKEIAVTQIANRSASEAVSAEAIAQLRAQLGR